MRVSSTTRVVPAVSHRLTCRTPILPGNDRHADRDQQDNNHEASQPHAAEHLQQLACRQCTRLLGNGGGSAERGEDLRLDTSHAVDKRCRVAVLPLDGSEWQNTRRVRWHPWQRRELPRQRQRWWQLHLRLSGALGGKLDKSLLACTSLVGAEFFRVFHLGGGEGPSRPSPRTRRAVVQSASSRRPNLHRLLILALLVPCPINPRLVACPFACPLVSWSDT